jgi:hypothetical protein
MQTQHIHEEIGPTHACPNGCKCHQQETEGLCEAMDVGLENYLECMETHAFECPSAVRFARVYYCSCPTRVQLAREH